MHVCLYPVFFARPSGEGEERKQVKRMQQIYSQAVIRRFKSLQQSCPLIISLRVSINNKKAGSAQTVQHGVVIEMYKFVICVLQCICLHSCSITTKNQQHGCRTHFVSLNASAQCKRYSLGESILTALIKLLIKCSRVITIQPVAAQDTEQTHCFIRHPTFIVTASACNRLVYKKVNVHQSMPQVHRFHQHL